MATGSVKFYNENKGYGFLKNLDGGPDVFVHVSNIAGGQPLWQDDQVSFEIVESPKGPSAVRVELISQG